MNKPINVCVYIYLLVNIKKYKSIYMPILAICIYTYIYIRISLLEHDTAHLFQVWAGGNVGK